MRGGEKDAPAVPIRKATGCEVEFINAGNDEKVVAAENREYERDQIRRGLRHVNKLSDAQIDAVTDRVIMGESIARIADELRVGKNALAQRVKQRCGLLYLRKWQQSVSFDCLRAELLLRRALSAGDDPRWGKIALDVLRYRAEVLGFDRANPLPDSQVRVAGMTTTQIFDIFAERL